MIEKVSNKVLRFITQNACIDNRLTEVYMYGIEITISTILNIVLTLIASVLVGDILCGLVFLATMIILRSYCGGYHADSYFKCNCVMLCTFLLTYIVCKVSVLYGFSTVSVMLPFYLIGFIPICVFAPVENKNKTLTKEKRKKCHWLSILLYIFIGVGGLLTTYFHSFYGSIIIITLINVSVMILIEIIKQRRSKNED